MLVGTLCLGKQLGKLLDGDPFGSHPSAFTVRTRSMLDVWSAFSINGFAKRQISLTVTDWAGS
jgi:hypothetical protein